MNFINRTALFLFAMASSSLSLQAQTITPLIVENDPASWGTNLVQRILQVDVNNQGDWLAVVDADPTGTALMSDLGVVHNGTLMYEELSNLGFPTSHTGWQFVHTVDAMDINDNGDILVQVTIEDTSGMLPSRDLVLWTSGATGFTYPLLETQVTPTENMLGEPAGFEEPAGAVWNSIITVWQNNNNQLVVRGRSDADLQDMLVSLVHDGAGTIISQTMFVVDGSIHDQAFPPSNGTHAAAVTSMSNRPVELALNDSGQKLFFVNDNEQAPGQDVNSHYYLDDVEVAWEADMSPTGSGFPYGDLKNAEVDINSFGDWVAVFDDDGPFGTDQFISLSGSVFVREGDLVPGFDPMLGFTLRGSAFGPVQISNRGEVTWRGQWSDPDPTTDSGLFRDQTLIVQEGVTSIGGQLVKEISTSHGGMAVSDSGRYVIVNLDLETSFGPNEEGIFLIDLGTTYPSLCNGDGGNQMGCTNCPCGNNVPIGTLGGCLNSAVQSAQLRAEGDPSVSLPTGSSTDLRLSLTGAPPAVLCILTSGDLVAPVDMSHLCFGLNSGNAGFASDGLECAITNVRRHGHRPADSSGQVGATSPGWGGPDKPNAGIAARAGFASGQTRYFQVIYRDDALAICGTGVNSSQAVEVNFYP